MQHTYCITGQEVRDSALRFQIWIFEHFISRSGILSLDLSFSAVQQQIARPRSVGKVFLHSGLLFLGRFESCMLARLCGCI